MKLIEILKDIKFKGNIETNLEVTGISYDSRKVVPGDIFVAISGYQVDGHLYIDRAKNAGAVAIVVEKEGYEGINVIHVDSSRKTLALLSKNLYDSPTEKLKLIGVTGTNGKTSITYILKDMLESLNQRYGVIGTMKNLIGYEEFKTNVTTPESLELNQLFALMVERSTDVAVMEASSHALSLNRVDALDFDIAIFTNLTQDHLDYHESMTKYFAAKKKLFDMAQQAVINIDDEHGEKLYNEIKEKSLSYSCNKRADLKASQFDFSDHGTHFILTYKNREYEVKTNLIGHIYIYNTMAAIGALILLGFDMNHIIEATKAVKPVKGRLEQVPNKLGIKVIVDYAHTPDALENVLKISREFTQNRLISVFGCGGDRDKTKRPKMGKISERLADFSIVTSDNPRTEEPDMIINDILKGMPADSNKYSVVINREDAIKKSVEMAVQGDTIIIAGKGHETYQIIGKKISDFDDFKIAQRYLERRR